MNGQPLCDNCAPGYVFDIYGNCCDPWNTPGGCDHVGGSFMPSDLEASSMCMGVECPEGQACIQTVFGAVCR